jgi:hypothetical protein
MKYKFLIILTFIQFLSSCDLGENAKLEKCLKATIYENNCSITLNRINTNNKKDLVLTSQCENDSILFYGKLLYDFVLNLSKEKIHFDNYSILNNSKKELISFNNIEWGVISEKIDFFNRVVDGLEAKNYKKIYDFLSLEVKSQISYEDFKKTLDSSIKTKYDKFEGFTLLTVDGKKYICLSTTNGKYRILITLSFEKYIDIIYGYSLE